MEKLLSKSNIIANLEQRIEHGDKSALDEFWSDLKVNGAPLIESIDDDPEYSLVTFVYKGDKNADNILFYSQISWHNLPECYMTQLLDTDLWYITYKIKNDIRFKYCFSVNDDFGNNYQKRGENITGDLFNTNILVFEPSDKETHINPYVIMPNSKKDFWIKEQANITKGNLYEHQFESEKLDITRKVRVYTPYDYKKDGQPYGFLLLTDGNEYIDVLSAINVLDNLIANKKIPPIITIFVDSTDKRIEELKCNDKFADILIKELLPWAKNIYNISSNPSEAIIGGLSLGGLTASYLGLTHSETFGNVLSQSGSYWYDPEGLYMKDPDSFKNNCWMPNQFNSVSKLPLKFYLNVGTFENEDQMINTNKKLRDVLISKGYDVTFEEFQSGHDYLCWGETLANGLIALIGQ